VLDSKPFIAKGASLRQHKSFCNAAQYHGGLAKIWRRLGVAPLVGSKVVAPLALKLAWETGLNPESVLSLKRDCFQASHQLTGQPYLSYYKERSTGDKQLHLTLLDTKNPRRPQPEDLQMMPKQSAVIRRTIDLIKSLTERLRPHAAEEDREFLFLFQPFKHAKPLGRAIRITNGRVRGWAANVKDSVAMTGARQFNINLARFRPTKITQMVRDGYDFFHVQAVAGHSQAKTTAHYLAKHQLNPQAQREVSQTLARIHENRVEIERVPKPYANAETLANVDVTYKGIMCDCKDVYDPPDWVKRLPHFRPGRACTFWNMCLFCPNVLITRKHLPLLVSYAKEIEVALEHNSLRQAPNGAQYQKIQSLLGRIFDEEFDDEAVAWAKEVAENADYHLDAVTYRGVENHDTPKAIQKA
jgi:integrase